MGNCVGRREEEADGADSFSRVQTAIATNPELSELLESARKEEPLTGWGGIKVVTEEDLRE